jgi:hypothetical protein
VRNVALREALNWPEDRYWSVRDKLRDQKEIVVGSGPGGSVALADVEGRPAKVFVSYCHADEALKAELLKHLEPLRRQKLVEAWHDRKIQAGSEWKGEISSHLDTSDVILLLVSIDFINSNYCYEIELERALERHENGEATVIPIILRHCIWAETPFAKLQALPTDAKAISSWNDRDEALVVVAQGIRRAVEARRSKSSAS